MSRERRFFVPDLGPNPVELSLEEGHHLVHVLRLRPGAGVAVFDGKGRAARAEISSIAGERVSLRILSPEPSRESPLSLCVGIAPPKGDRMSVGVSKLTELGVIRILPLVAERGEIEPTLAEKTLPRWRRIALESCKQSGRSRIPELDPPRTLEDVLPANAGPILAAHPGSKPLDRNVAIQGGVTALVGPEGGWSESELALFASRGVLLFGLGPRTLRTETAAIAVATLLQWLAGDLAGLTDD